MTALELKALGIFLALAGLFGAWKWQEHEWKAEGAAQCKTDVATAVAVQQAAASATEAGWERKVDDLRRNRDAEMGSVTAARDAALASLHNRAPSRAVMSSAAASACNGASPALIDAPDASVAVGFAAEFDTLRADYEACTSWIKAVTH